MTWYIQFIIGVSFSVKFLCPLTTNSYSIFHKLIENKMNKKHIIYTALFFINIVVLMLIFQFSKYSAIIYENREMHSTLEAISAVITLIMAWFLYRKRNESSGGKFVVIIKQIES